MTLTGPGGIGKTRLAIQVAAELVDDFPDGVWFVRLSRLVDPGAGGAHHRPDARSARSRGASLSPRRCASHLAEKRLLLVLDNFEQVVGAAPRGGGAAAKPARACACW